jgi:dolichol-phosphate hexosyltransferase
MKIKSVNKTHEEIKKKENNKMTILSNVVQGSLEHEKIVFIIPTLNESSTIAEVVKKAKLFTDRIVVVDGHSQDDTMLAASEAGAEVILQAGKGKGMALRTAFSKIESDLYVIIDGDATYDVMELENIIRPVLKGEADMVVGSRLRGTMEDGSITFTNKIGNDLFNLLINSFFRGKITDSQSGFRAISRRAVENMNLSSEGFEVETEITIKTLKQGLKIKEVPITYLKRRGSRSKLNSFKAGSKILRTIMLNLA